jgi:hypothetical protein
MEVMLGLPETMLAWIAPRPWLHVSLADDPFVAWGRWSVPLELVRVESPVDAERLLDRLSRQRGPGQPAPLLVGSYLRASLREELEKRGLSYLDRRGSLHLSWQNGIIHIESRAAARDGAAGAPEPHVASLGVHGVRAVQALLSAGDDQQVSRLAELADLSVSRTHAVLRLLESEGLVRVTGKGPSTRRHVIDKSRLLDWLAVQPAARRRERQMSVALYARTPGEAWRLISQRLDREHIPHGLTGSAAAAALGAGPTTVMVSGVRISPHISLHDATKALEAESTERGANVKLIRDTGMLGSAHTSEHDGVRIAPLVRVYLDALSERRGEDIAQNFRESVLGY